jgi:hypothetical protein
MDSVILDEVGCLPVSANGGALLFHLISKLHEKTSLIIATNLSFSEWVKVFGDAKMTTRTARPHPVSLVPGHGPGGSRLRFTRASRRTVRG